MDKKDRKLLKSKLFAWPLPLPHTDKKTTGARFRRRIHNSEEKRKSRHALSSADYKVNKTLCERIFGRSRTMGMIL